MQRETQLIAGGFVPHASTCPPWDSAGPGALAASSPGTRALHDSGSRLAVLGRGKCLQNWDKFRDGSSLCETSMDQMTPAAHAGTWVSAHETGLWGAWMRMLPGPENRWSGEAWHLPGA